MASWGGGIPKDVVDGGISTSIDGSIKKLVDAGYSKVLARILTMGGCHQDETDYLLENTHNNMKTI
ncbi:MAG: hypothetical protein IE885_06915 [Campylobacterales bacterium]|nr:hypothetical protein [Campylobacterales bacterium]